MSAFGMKPEFGDEAGWRRWRQAWRAVQRHITREIRKAKRAAREAQKNAQTDAPVLQKALAHHRAMGRKVMSLLDEGKARWQRVLAVRQQIADQDRSFPIHLADCKTVDFHFNKGHLTMPDLPMWVVKAKGQQFYVRHVSASVPWSTRELPEGSTKGMIRFRDCSLTITKDAEAILSPQL